MPLKDTDLHFGDMVTFDNGQVVLTGEVVQVVSQAHIIAALDPATALGARPLYYWAIQYLTLI